VYAAEELTNLGGYESESEAKKNIARAVEEVAGRLGNTPAVCRKCYVHPAVLESYIDGSLAAVAAPASADPAVASGLAPEEIRVLELLKRRLMAA
jgi:DNA topoisomerase-1